MIDTFWNVGKYIVEYEQHGNSRAEYGKDLLGKLSKDLILRLGKTYNRVNLTYMRKLYSIYPICKTLSYKLSWSHYYATYNNNNNLFVSKYELYLPNKEELKKIVDDTLSMEENNDKM